MADATPRIAYSSLLATATLTASPATVDTDGAVENCTDWLTWTFWRPTGSGPWTLVCDFGSAQSVGAWAMAGHDASGTVTMETWNGSAWVAHSSAAAIGDSAVLYVVGDTVSTTKIRFTFPTISYLAVLWAGVDVVLPEGVGPGWSDPVLALRAKTTHETSRMGVWLGTTVEQWTADLSLSLKSVASDWVSANWKPFVRACSTQPFFLHWNTTEWAGSACLCTRADFGDTPFASKGFIDVSVKFNADPGYDRRTSP